MAVVAVIRDKKGMELVLPWASSFARARRTSLTVVCWTHTHLSSAPKVLNR